jgi:hypothetical protein
MSRSKLRRGWSGTFAVAALILLVGTNITRAASTTAWSATYRATEAIDHVLGTKRAIGYFQTNHGQCELTLMIAEVVDPDLAMPLSAARLHFALHPGEKAALASEEGPEIVLICGADATTLEVMHHAARS